MTRTCLNEVQLPKELQLAAAEARESSAIVPQ